MTATDDYYTYQDIAARLKLHTRTVSRLVVRLEELKLIKPFRPSRTVVRLSPEDVQTLLQYRAS